MTNDSPLILLSFRTASGVRNLLFVADCQTLSTRVAQSTTHWRGFHRPRIPIRAETPARPWGEHPRAKAKSIDTQPGGWPCLMPINFRGCLVQAPLGRGFFPHRSRHNAETPARRQDETLTERVKNIDTPPREPYPILHGSPFEPRSAG